MKDKKYRGQSGKIFGVGQFSHKASHPRKSLDDKIPEEKSNIPFCPHNLYCFKRKQQGYNYCLEQEAKECGQVKKFYDKWKEDGNFLGIGS